MTDAACVNFACRFERPVLLETGEALANLLDVIGRDWHAVEISRGWVTGDYEDCRSPKCELSRHTVTTWRRLADEGRIPVPTTGRSS